MLRNRIKTLFIFIFLGASGMSGCDTAGSRAKSEAAQNFWAVGDVGLIRENKHYLDFKNSEEKLRTYELSDVIRFYNFSENRLYNAKIKVTTACFKENQALTPYTFTEKMLENYALYKFLPIEAVFSLHETDAEPLICSFDIVAQNANGDSHRFELPAAPIIYSAITDPLLVFKGYKNISADSPGLIEVNRADWSSYFLPALSVENQSYDFVCTQQRGTTNISSQDYNSQDSSSPINFAQFKTDDGDAHDFANILSAQYCRIFLRQTRGRILQMTNLFIVKPYIVRPLVTTLFRSPLIQNHFPGYITVANYKIDNITKTPMVVGFDSAQTSQIELQLTIKKIDHPNVYGTFMRLPLKVQVGGANPIEKNQQIRFTIPAGLSATVSLSFMLHSAKIACENNYTATGAYYHFLGQRNLVLKIFDALDSPSTALHQLDQVEIEPPFERYAKFVFFTNMKDARNPPPPLPPQTPPPPPPLILSNFENVCRSI